MVLRGLENIRHAVPTILHHLSVLIALGMKRRRLRQQESDGDVGAGEKKERKTEAEVVG